MSDQDHAGTPTLDSRLFDAARQGDVATLTALLDEHPDKLQLRTTPYEHTLLHLAAAGGDLASVELLLQRGLDVNDREKGDNTYPMHWAAAAGHLDVVRRLADAGGDVIGHGDDHQLEVIGWATCWDPGHADVAEFLVSRGARHHIFSAIAMNLADEVRRIAAENAAALNQTMSRNEEYQRPLHFAVRKNRPEMVALLLELGADPLGTDGTGYPPAVYASGPDIDRSVIEMIRTRTGTTDLFTALALGKWDTAERLLNEGGGAAAAASASERAGGVEGGVLHLMAKRNNVEAVKWLLARGFDPNARWSHWDAEVTPLHLAVMQGHADVVRLLLQAGADPRIHDSKHDADPIGWADFFGRQDLVDLMKAHVAKT